MWAKLIVAAAVACALSLCIGGGAWAFQPVPWQMGMQPAASPIAEQMHGFHNLLLVITGSIVVFVTGLILYVLVRFNAKAHPIPSKFTHNTLVEVIWTVFPVVILLVIAIPSFRLLYAQDASPEAELTIKAVGHQWYWTYEYPDAGFEFDATIVDEADLKEGQLRLLETDAHMVVPVNAVVRMLITASPEDVIHAWAVPAFGVKVDAVPGRLNETWFKATRTGVFYGQCSELCGTFHGYMPINVDVVTQAEYDAWLSTAKMEYTEAGEDGQVRLAAVKR